MREQLEKMGFMYNIFWCGAEAADNDATKQPLVFPDAIVSDVNLAGTRAG